MVHYITALAALKIEGCRELLRIHRLTFNFDVPRSQSRSPQLTDSTPLASWLVGMKPGPSTYISALYTDNFPNRTHWHYAVLIASSFLDHCHQCVLFLFSWPALDLRLVLLHFIPHRSSIIPGTILAVVSTGATSSWSLERLTFVWLGSGNEPIQISSFEVSPDPPQPGQNLTMTVKYEVAREIEV